MIARRTKSVTHDGATFVISALSFDELEAYGIMQKDLGEAIEAKKDIREKARTNTFFVLCCGLNNAVKEIQEAQELLQFGKIDQPAFEDKIRPFAVTTKILRSVIDDLLASNLWRDILIFTGLKLPTEEEIAKMAEESAAKTLGPPSPTGREISGEPEGESQASC